MRLGKEIIKLKYLTEKQISAMLRSIEIILGKSYLSKPVITMEGQVSHDFRYHKFLEIGAKVSNMIVKFFGVARTTG